MPAPVHRALLAAPVALWVATLVAAQADVMSGRWVAAAADQGVVVTLTLGPSSTLVIPGTGPGGRIDTLTLAVKNLKRGERSVTFSVILPDASEIEFEFSLDQGNDSGVLRVRSIDGEPPDDDLPTWPLTRQRQP